MPITRVFQSGDSQAVQLPKEFHFDVEEVEIFRRGDETELRPSGMNGAAIFDTLHKLPADFMQDSREDSLPQKRDRLESIEIKENSYDQ